MPLSLYRLNGRWIRLSDPLIASKWIHLVDLHFFHYPALENKEDFKMT